MSTLPTPISGPLQALLARIACGPQQASAAGNSASDYDWSRPSLYTAEQIGQIGHFGEGLAASFIIGWAVRMLVMRFGGAMVYQRCKPLMYGLVAGDVLGGIVPLVISTIYYFATGNEPLQFNVMPT